VTSAPAAVEARNLSKEFDGRTVVADAVRWVRDPD